MDCLEPPIAESPPVRWHCPICPPVEEGYIPEDSPLVQIDGSSTGDGSLAPSSSRKNGKGRAASDDDSDEEPTHVIKSSPKKKRKPNKAVIKYHSDEDVRPTQQKRRKLKSFSHASPPSRGMTIRLRLPGRGKEEERKGLFDDILSTEERDTVKTAIEEKDKHRFERSRAAAEVCHGSDQSRA